MSVCNHSFSQSTSGSVYNIFGVGTLDQYGLTPYRSMGNAGIASRSTENVNLKNPASLNAIVGYNQIFDAGLYYSSINQVLSNKSFATSTGGITELNYWFRPNNKMALAFGASKFSDTSYDITDSNIGNTFLGNYETRHMGDGGLSQIYLGSSYQIGKNLSIGARANFLFGSMKNTEILTLTEFRTDLLIEKKESFVKAIMDFGGQYVLKLDNKRNIVFGATLRHGANTTLNVENNIISNSADSLSSEDKIPLYIPQRIGAGVSFNLPSWQFNIDYELEKWGNNESQEGYKYKDRALFSFGGQYQKDRFSDTYIDRIAFRFGAAMHSNYVSIDETDYSSYLYTLGLGFPLNNGNLINLGYQYYKNGTSKNGLVVEQTHSVSLNFSFKDIWFRKRIYN